MVCAYFPAIARSHPRSNARVFFSGVVVRFQGERFRGRGSLRGGTFQNSRRGRFIACASLPVPCEGLTPLFYPPFPFPSCSLPGRDRGASHGHFREGHVVGRIFLLPCLRGGQWQGIANLDRRRSTFPVPCGCLPSLYGPATRMRSLCVLNGGWTRKQNQDQLQTHGSSVFVVLWFLGSVVTCSSKQQHAPRCEPSHARARAKQEGSLSFLSLLRNFLFQALGPGPLDLSSFLSLSPTTSTLYITGL